MITVSISINGEPLFARSARNTLKAKGKRIKYVTDTKESIWHDPEDGAIVLAKKMLDTIDEHMESEGSDG